MTSPAAPPKSLMERMLELPEGGFEERTHWSPERLRRYAAMGYSAERLAKLSGHSVGMVEQLLGVKK